MAWAAQVCPGLYTVWRPSEAAAEEDACCRVARAPRGTSLRRRHASAAGSTATLPFRRSRTTVVRWPVAARGGDGPRGEGSDETFYTP
jgi:hypothetical protein